MTRVERTPSGSRYADQRHYAVPARLSDLRGPRGGMVTLDRSLDWSGDATYDLDHRAPCSLAGAVAVTLSGTGGRHLWRRPVSVDPGLLKLAEPGFG